MPATWIKPSLATVVTALACPGKLPGTARYSMTDSFRLRWSRCSQAGVAQTLGNEYGRWLVTAFSEKESAVGS
jgi:hypothetical protein